MDDGWTNASRLKLLGDPALEAHRGTVSGDQRMAQTRPTHLIRRAGAGRSPQTHRLTPRGFAPKTFVGDGSVRSVRVGRSASGLSAIRFKPVDRPPVHELSAVNGHSLRFKYRATDCR